MGAALVLMWANLPYLVGYARSTPDLAFGGFFIFEQDGFSYLVKMRQGATDGWEYRLAYTSEPFAQRGEVIFTLYFALGKLERLVRVPAVVLYHAARLGADLLLLALLYRFITHPRLREAEGPSAGEMAGAYGLILVSGGLGWLLTLWNPRYVSLELVAPDAYLFSMLYGPPHVPLAMALLLAFWLVLLTGVEGGLAWRRLLALNLLALGAVLARPAYALVLYPLLGLWWLGGWLLSARSPADGPASGEVRRKARWPDLRPLLAALAPLPYLAYFYRAFQTNRAYRLWAAQNPFVTPGVGDLLAGFGLLLLPALLTLARERRRWRHPRWRLFLTWAVAGLFLAYAPVPVSRRLLAGWQVPLALLAVRTFARWHRRRPTRPLPYLLTGLLLPSTFLVILGGTALVLQRPAELFQSADERAMLAWLADHGGGQDVVLSAWRTGNRLPAWTSVRVYVGHPIETLAFDEKEEAVRRFFDPTTPDRWRQEFLRRWQITYVVHGPFERALGGWSPEDAPYLKPAFKQGEYTVYRVRE
ncbi:MAG: hypothetical protein D6759_07635 [Chloroflexi bacterium]|nr:MAG: hypothetical protein D6759_07635 [Chloroflexota bacterium]